MSMFKPHQKKTAIYMNILGEGCISVQQDTPGKVDPELEAAIRAAAKAFWKFYDGQQGRKREPQ